MKGIFNDRQLQVTEDKLALLQAQYLKTKANEIEDAHVRELSLRSLKKWINRLTEEVVRYRASLNPKANDRRPTTVPSDDQSKL